jgi:formyl-CoA transferase
MGNELDEFVPYGVYETSDSHIAIVAARGHHWESLCTALGRTDWLEGGKFDTIEKRRTNRAQLRSALEAELQDRTSMEWFEIFADHGIPTGPVYDTKEVWDDHHVESRDLLDPTDVDGEEFSFIKHPVDFSTFNTDVSKPVPELGEDTVQVLKQIGYTEEEIAALQTQGTVQAKDTE